MIRPALIVMPALALALIATDGMLDLGAFSSAPVLQAPTAAPAVPADLKPLLARPVSEMRLVITRYSADRQELNANYAGPGGFDMPGGRGGGRAGGAQA